MMRFVAGALVLAAWVLSASAQDPQVIPVMPLASAPTVDGSVEEWGAVRWTPVPIKPAVAASDRAKLGLAAEDNNHTGAIAVQLRAGVHSGRFFLAARWPDEAADVEYKGWDWSETRYVESKQREDMFALRFHLDGDFDRSMLAAKTYRVDVWLWSAARTNPLGLAEDMLHSISNRMIEEAAEYSTRDHGVIYIKKQRDAGTALYQVQRPPKVLAGRHLPGMKLNSGADGSIADVTAKGVWKAGFWTLEMSRKMDTGNSDDVSFKPGQKHVGQIAVFNHSSDEHKSVSEPLLFDFSRIR
jgi:hypothetical protein